MMRLALALLLAGCAVGPRSYDSTLTPVEHRAIRALVGATVTFGGEAFGVRPTVALIAGTVGVLAVTKAELFLVHPERLGPWTAGDLACDLVWQSAVLPLWLSAHPARGGRPRSAGWARWRWPLLAGAAWAGAAFLVQRRCVP